jgi:hypothetical protein
MSDVVVDMTVVMPVEEIVTISNNKSILLFIFLKYIPLKGTNNPSTTSNSLIATPTVVGSHNKDWHYHHPVTFKLVD